MDPHRKRTAIVSGTAAASLAATVALVAIGTPGTAVASENATQSTTTSSSDSGTSSSTSSSSDSSSGLVSSGDSSSSSHATTSGS